ncbi:alpha/beta-hydrolase [Piromyces finnis]|uniref:Alpha/beta-hydrolase n=1 Tax=Piromyces finnis TaxID=1754191 RepID=A0A1Y1V814_9FUNG|nr:alpha/beta-hydrolase [Piromyces finnis]|eukprot:ORX48680.1 alpha/beta-hydrolase [Piromyces finnis]
MKSSILIKLFSFIAVAASIYASPISKKHHHKEKITLAVDSNVNFYHDLDLDVYYQKSNLKKLEKKPVVIYIYGGGCENGYITVIPNYHIHPNATNIDTMVDDVHHAIQWTYKNIHKYGGDKKKMTLSGHSAGSHLAALTLVKSSIGMKNLGKPLKKLPTFKDVLLLNGLYVVGDIEKGIELFSSIGMMNYVEAFKDLFLNKTNYNPQDILAERKNKSIKSFGTIHITLLECTKDTDAKPGSAKLMIDQIERTVKKISTSTYLFDGNHNAVNHGIRDGDEEARKVYMELLTKYNKP